MFTAKYIRMNNDDVVITSRNRQHCMCAKPEEVKSAGMFLADGSEITIFGDSVSLDAEPAPDDATVLARFLGL